MTQALYDRLAVLLDESPVATVRAGATNWASGPHPAAGTKQFGSVINAVRSIVPHQTSGWPPRNKANGFVRRYTTPHYTENGKNKWGIGTQYYISSDGTAFGLIELPRLTWHAEFVNPWSIGVETGNLDTTASPPGSSWIALSGDAEHIPGAKAWMRDHTDNPREAIVGWWTTASYAGPARAPVGAGHMLFTEWQYRTWALLGRYLAEYFGVPRNVPLLPHAQRGDTMTSSEEFRRIVLADPRFDMFVTAMAGFSMTAPDFLAANAATLHTRYTAGTTYQARTTTLKRHNKAWKALFDVYRGFHGHGFAGSIGRDPRTGRDHQDHDCPGPLFDWHRFARELWEWWWFPFDFDDALTTTRVPRRPYQNPDATTPLIEYYFDENETARITRIRVGVHGQQSSPETFELEPGSPVYAMANGELVAARIPTVAAAFNQVSLGFALVRHEVFHLPDPHGQPGAIDYSRPPSVVYTLYMHLVRPSFLDFDHITADNPDWLNRVLARKKECDLGVDFYDGHATHHGIPDAAWNSQPPGSVVRPTTLESWRIDQIHLDAFLTLLRRGDVALAPSRSSMAHPINILLGDFLGSAGIYKAEGDAAILSHGVRIEAFSPLVPLPGFSIVPGIQRWNPPSGLPDPPVIWYQSEWARTPTGTEADALRENGVDLDAAPWWPDVSILTSTDPELPVSARIPANGYVWHYRALDIARWLNALTWASEWNKYQVTDAGGNPVARPVRPRSRRV